MNWTSEEFLSKSVHNYFLVQIGVVFINSIIFCICVKGVKGRGSPAKFS